MERILAVIFNNEKKAYEATSALRQLEREGSVVVYGGAVVTKRPDGSLKANAFDDPGPVGSLAGAAIGGLIGLLSGPAGLVVGTASGFAVGALADIDAYDDARVGEDFVSDIFKSLTPNKVAVVAEVDEEWTTPVDARMEALGGTVYRRAMWEVRRDVDDKELAAMNADLEQIDKEAKQANAERRAKLQKNINDLKARIETRKKQQADRRHAFETRQQSKKEVLKKKAAAAGRALKDLANTPV